MKHHSWRYGFGGTCGNCERSFWLHINVAWWLEMAFWYMLCHKGFRRHCARLLLIPGGAIYKREGFRYVFFLYHRLSCRYINSCFVLGCPKMLASAPWNHHLKIFGIRISPFSSQFAAVSTNNILYQIWFIEKRYLKKQYTSMYNPPFCLQLICRHSF